jgi:hypothetical protein
VGPESGSPGLTSAALAGVQYRPPENQYLDVVNGESALPLETFQNPKLFNLYMDPKERYSFFDRQTFLENLPSDPISAHMKTFQEYPGKKATIQAEVEQFVDSK